MPIPEDIQQKLDERLRAVRDANPGNPQRQRDAELDVALTEVIVDMIDRFTRAFTIRSGR